MSQFPIKRHCLHHGIEGITDDIDKLQNGNDQLRSNMKDAEKVYSEIEEKHIELAGENIV
jgi:hypothetical protein